VVESVQSRLLAPAVSLQGDPGQVRGGRQERFGIFPGIDLGAFVPLAALGRDAPWVGSAQSGSMPVVRTYSTKLRMAVLAVLAADADARPSINRP